MFEGFMLATGAMVFAVAAVVLIGRWITAEENWLGVLIRGAILLGLAVACISRLGTVWYWLLMPLAAFPLIEAQLAGILPASWRIPQGAEARLEKAINDAAQQPFNPILQLTLGRRLLETGQMESGLGALEEAVKLASESDSKIVQEMAAETKGEFVKFCPCGAANPAEALVCHRCLLAIDRTSALQIVLWALRPVLVLFRRNKVS